MARREYPGVYPYPTAGGRTLYRTLYTDSNGRQRQKRGFSSPSAAAAASTWYKLGKVSAWFLARIAALRAGRRQINQRLTG